MKIILGILCGLVVLFAGGCAIVLAGSAMTDGSGIVLLALIPGALALLNALVLLGMWGRKPPQRWAFYLLAGLDVLAAIALAIFWKSISFQVGDFWTIAVPGIAVLLVKAVLTELVARQLPAGSPPQG